MKCNQDYRTAMSLIRLAVDRAEHARAIRKDVVDAIALDPIPELVQFQRDRELELLEAQTELDRVKHAQSLLETQTETLLVFETEEQSNRTDLAAELHVSAYDIYECDRERTVFLVDCHNKDIAMVLKLRFT